jgi:gliding motility-associated-like protein
LKVFPVGIKSFTFFAVYNRYGELIFRTTDYSKGWDGTYKGKPLDSGTFVAIAQAIDYKGKLLSTKGTVILLR